MYKLRMFIDDIRMPADVGLKNSDFYIVRDPELALQKILMLKPQHIAFDHDLANTEHTGYDVARALVDFDQDCPSEMYITADFTFTCHSANPIGKENILRLLNNYMEHKFGRV